MFLQLSEDLQKINRVHRRSKLDFDLQVQDMFVNDPDTRSGRNVRDREAIASVKLRAEREMISSLESSQEDIAAVMSVVKAKREDLKDVQGRIRDQIKLCQEEMALGGKWGSAPPPGATPVDLDTPRPVLRTQGGVPPESSEEEEEESEGNFSDLEAFIASEVGTSSGYVEMGAETGAPSSEPVQAPTVGDIDLDDLLSTEATLEVKPVLTPNTAVSGSEIQEVSSPAPEVVGQDEPSESVTLPDINEVQEPAPTVSKAEVDAFFDDLDVATPPEKPSKSTVADEFDLNDILGGLV